jgi:uncharacterized ion transporter superfamily protein YfcC
MVGVSFAILDKTGILKASIARIVRMFGGNKYPLLWVICFFFMLIGAFFGIFEEVVPLVPLMVALSFFLGWDSLVGLGMSVLAVNMGFSAAITNPFTIGVAQRIAGLPLFSGAWLRIIFFIVVYVIFGWFLTSYARKVEKDPTSSLTYHLDGPLRSRYQSLDISGLTTTSDRLKPALVWFLVCLGLIMVVLLGGPFIPGLSDYSLPIVGVLFLVGGVGAGFVSGSSGKKIWSSAWEGLTGIAPGIPLILMAASVKYIAAQGAILDTFLNQASGYIEQAGAFTAALAAYLLALILEIFIGSATAKAFLVMPILLPLADMVGITRQVTILAYCFGDGFSNMAYPTNPVLLISLGLTTVSYPLWIRWTIRLWLPVILVSILFLWIAVSIGYGPF